MDNFLKEFLMELKEKRPTYRDMIDFCCDGLILNNVLIFELQDKGFYFEDYCGEINYETEIYQYYIISEKDAERFAEYTNEIVLCNEDLQLYFLCVTHFGTAWSGVSSNWREI